MSWNEIPEHLEGPARTAALNRREFLRRSALTAGIGLTAASALSPGQVLAQLSRGFMAEGSGNDEFALSYYNRGELGFIHAAAEKFNLYDKYFCSLLGPTWPNRYYEWSAQSGGRKDNSPPIDQ